MDELTIEKQGGELSAYKDPVAFEQLQRVGTMLADSIFVPKEFSGKVSDCAIVANVAYQMGIDPMVVLQNTHVIHGRPGFTSSFIIALINASGKFTPLNFDIGGEGDQLGCHVVANRMKSGERVKGPRVDVAMAKAQGWWQKNGSKWPSMTETMLTYRAATFFARTYCPEVLMGFKSEDEVIDIQGEEIKAVEDVSFGVPSPKAIPEPVATEVKATEGDEPSKVDQTPQAKLQDIVCNDAGSDWQVFKKWACISNQFTEEQGREITRFDEVPDELATKFVRAKKGMIKGFKTVKL